MLIACRNGVEERYDAYAKMGERGFQTGEPGVAEAAPGLVQVGRALVSSS